MFTEMFSYILLIFAGVASLIVYKLISHLHDVVLRRDECGNPIETKLQQVSQDLHTVIKTYLQDTVESMVRSAQDKCPHVLSDEKIVNDIRSVCLEKTQISQQLVEEAIVEQAGAVILNKVNEVNLSVASAVSDRVIDEVVESLSKTCKNLQCGSEGPRKRASTGAELSSVDRSSESSTRSDRSTDITSPLDDNHSHKSDPSPLATPQLASKRKSLHGRKLRPQSVVDSQVLKELLSEDQRITEGQRFSPLPLSKTTHRTDEVIDEVTPQETDSPQENSSSSSSESLDSVSELPSSCGQLQHLGKARPRRAKTHAPTRPMGRAGILEEGQDISQGVDHFFRPGSATPTTPLVSPDSENSPRLLKYGSTSSMESFPQTTGARTASDRGSLESLTASESLVRSESDNLKRRSRDTEDELQDHSIIEVNEHNGEERRSISSLIGKLGGEAALKLSPDLGPRKSSSLSEPPEEDDSPPKRLSSGLQKYGRGIGGNVLAEMKARQKLASSSPKEEDSPTGGGLLAGVRLRTTGLKSPSNGLSRSPIQPKDSTETEGSDRSPFSSSPKPVITSFKPKLPPPLAPKPRPKSAFSPDYKAGCDHDVTDGMDEPSNKRSVRELAASLASKGVANNSSVNSDDSGKKKSSSLPRNSTPVISPSANVTSGLPNVLSSQATTLSDRQMEELEETPIDGETQTHDTLSLQRQISQKHVVSSTMSVDDVVNV